MLRTCTPHSAEPFNSQQAIIICLSVLKAAQPNRFIALEATVNIEERDLIRRREGGRLDGILCRLRSGLFGLCPLLVAIEAWIIVEVEELRLWLRPP